MLTQLKKEAEVFAQFNRKMFGEWMWKEMQLIYSPPSAEKIRGIDSIGLAIMRQETVSEGLAYVYENYVPEPKKLMFRQAIGDILREQGNQEDVDFQMINDFIYLIARIKAIEAVDAFLPTVGNGLLGKNPAALWSAFTILCSLAPSPQVYEATSQMINSVNFDDGYLFEAINILAECNPSQVPAIVQSLESRLEKLRRMAEQLGGDEWPAFCLAVKHCPQYAAVHPL